MLLISLCVDSHCAFSIVERFGNFDEIAGGSACSCVLKLTSLNSLD